MEYAIQDTFQITHPPQCHFSNTYPKKMEFTPTLHYMQISKALILSPEMSFTRTPLAKCIGLKKPLEGWRMAWRRIKADNCREEPCSIALTFNLTDASKVDTHSKGNDEFQFLSFKR